MLSCPQVCGVWVAEMVAEMVAVMVDWMRAGVVGSWRRAEGRLLRPLQPAVSHPAVAHYQHRQQGNNQNRDQPGTRKTGNNQHKH